MIFKNASACAGKKVKDRITVLLTCNMTETLKMKPPVIGKSKSPRCFKGVKNLPVEYVQNASAWMTASIFEDSLHKWDRQLNKKNKKFTSSGKLSGTSKAELGEHRINFFYLPTLCRTFNCSIREL
jgi:hypothetical protein